MFLLQSHLIALKKSIILAHPILILHSRMSHTPSSGDKPPAVPTLHFTLFKRLPAEVQDLVWQTAIDNFGPRILPYKVSTLDSRFSHLCLPLPVPNILHVCQSSRRLSLKRWQLAWNTPEDYLGVEEKMKFLRTWPLEGGPPKEDAGIEQKKFFFDFAQDTLFFAWGGWHGLGSKVEAVEVGTCLSDRLALKKLAFILQGLPMRGYEGFGCARNIHRLFPALESIVLVPDIGFYDVDFDQARFYDCPFENCRPAGDPMLWEDDAAKRYESMTRVRTRHNLSRDFLEEFKTVYNQNQWRPCPKWTYVKAEMKSRLSQRRDEQNRTDILRMKNNLLAQGSENRDAGEPGQISDRLKG